MDGSLRRHGSDAPGHRLRAIGQRDPLVEYKHEAFAMFNDMIASIQEEIVRFVYFANVVERPQERKNLTEHHSQAAGGQEQPEKKKPAVSHKVGRNDPCPCGSGKKYKQCCGKNA